jgi:hypothetical protein
VILHALALVHGGGEKRSRVDLMLAEGIAERSPRHEHGGGAKP